MATTRTLTIALLMAALTPNLAGCGGPCDRAYHPWGAVLHLDSRSATGMYRVEVDIGTETLLVAYSTSTDGQASCVSPCADTQGMFRLGPTFGSGLFPASDVELSVRRTDDTTGPAQFQLRIYRDDVLVSDEEIRPSYRTTEPSGEGCGEKTSAEIDVVVP